MIDTKFFDDIAKKLTDALPPALGNAKEEMQRNFKAILSSTFAKLDLVSREEFDLQREVLAKTRLKLEELERRVANLENPGE